MTCHALRAMAAALLLSIVVPAATATFPVQAENWPQWRGAHHDAISGEKGLPTQFDRDKNVRWRLPLPGQAGATPIVWGDRIFVTSVDGGGTDLLLLCIST